jgi:predicted ATPase
MRRIVVTSGPGAGKTTLLAELSARGYEMVSESAREVIAERLARGLPPRPDPPSFATEILRRDDQKYHRPHRAAGPIFYDRSAVEGLAMVHESSPLSEEELKAKLSGYTFHRTVFVLPPWQEIYVNDTERDHSYIHAVTVHGQIAR